MPFFRRNLQIFVQTLLPLFLFVSPIAIIFAIIYVFLVVNQTTFYHFNLHNCVVINIHRFWLCILSHCIPFSLWPKYASIYSKWDTAAVDWNDYTFECSYLQNYSATLVQNVLLSVQCAPASWIEVLETLNPESKKSSLHRLFQILSVFIPFVIIKHLILKRVLSYGSMHHCKRNLWSVYMSSTRNNINSDCKYIIYYFSIV